MNAEDMKELKELIEFLKDNNIGEFDLERGDLKVRIKFAQEGGADMAALARLVASQPAAVPAPVMSIPAQPADRKSTRLNSSHPSISYAVFCLKKKKTLTHETS